MSQIAELPRALGDFAFRDGQGGISIHPCPGGGAQLYAMSAKNVPRHWTAEELAILETILPKAPSRRLGSALANEETRRRVEFLEDRRKRYSNLRSLDPDDRPMPAKGAKVKPEKLPRLYAGIHPESGTLAIFGSELSLPGTNLRGDELVFEVDLEAKHLDKIKAEKPLDIRELLRSTDFTSARALYYVDNLPETGKKARTHHLKSISTLNSFTRHIIKEFKLTIVGELTQMAQDEWLETRTFTVGKTGNVRSIRDAAEGGNFSMTVVRGVPIEKGVEISPPTRPLYSAMTFLDSMAAHHKKVLREAKENFGRRRILGRRG